MIRSVDGLGDGQVWKIAFETPNGQWFSSVFAAVFDDDPAPFYRELRTRAPVYFWPMAEAYLVSRYDDILAMMKDPRLSRSQRDSASHEPLPDAPRERHHRRPSRHETPRVAQQRVDARSLVTVRR